MILGEAGKERIADAIARADACFISPAAVVEITMVLARSIREPRAALAVYLQNTGIRICTLDPAHAEFAQEAFLKFGKGRHPARLNFGDCFSYAAAKALNASLLYVGDDFAKTDIRTA